MSQIQYNFNKNDEYRTPAYAVYPILKRLEKAGYVTTYSQEFQGRKRKYYSITPSGKEQMHYLHTEWNAYRDTIDGIIEGRIRH